MATTTEPATSAAQRIRLNSLEFCIQCITEVNHSRTSLARKWQATSGVYDLIKEYGIRLLEGGIPYPVVASMMGWSAATHPWNVTDTLEARRSAMPPTCSEE